MKITVLGLSITSSWGNGHATTWRSLLRALAGRGHEIAFLERDVPWYARARDLPQPPFCRTFLYRSLEELYDAHGAEVREADLVLVGSYVPDGVAVADRVLATARGVTAFYDIDTPVTLAKLRRREYEYLHPRQVPRFDLYLSFSGGAVLAELERRLGAPRARALHCSVDSEAYRPIPAEPRFDLGYLGTYGRDRQPALERFLIRPARRWRRGRFAVAGPQYPSEIEWPPNVWRADHLPPGDHCAFYNAQRFTLNVTRADMVRCGFSPSVRLFEAAACGVPVISDAWQGIDRYFLPRHEILIAREPRGVLGYLRDLAEEARREIGRAARRRVLAEHTAEHRAEELESYVLSVGQRTAAWSAA